MQRTEPDAEPRLLLDDYGKASQRWLKDYAAASEVYKRAVPSGPEALDSDIHLLTGEGASRTERWLERFARQKADFGPYGGPPPNLTPREAPELHLLLEDYAPGPRFVQEFRKLVGRNGSAAAERSKGNAPTLPAVPGPVAVAAPTRTPSSSRPAESPGRQKRSAPLASVPAPPASVTAEDIGLDLELDWKDTDAGARQRRSQVSSLAGHALLFVILMLLPHAAPPPLPDAETLRNMETVSLVAPSAADLAELTRRTPNQQETTKLFEGLTEPARPAVVPPPPAPPRQVIQVPDPPQIEPRPAAPEPAPKLEVEKPDQPEVADARSPAPGLTQPGQNRPRLRPDELPVLNVPKRADSKLDVEQATATGLGRDGDLQIGNVRLNARPDEVIQAAVDSLVAGGGSQIVGDGYSGGAGPALPSSPGNRGSTLELLSDPKGVDFRPYLIQVLAAVRRNWYAVIPESARLGMSRGRVAIQFIISRDGGVPKLVIAGSANVNALDHAAVAGISASVPFQRLPVEFAGNEIRLQFVFLYNVKR
jgi:outer membrane biosynthesis protein TonB